MGKGKDNVHVMSAFFNPEATIDRTNRELESSTAGKGLCLSRHVVL